MKQKVKYKNKTMKYKNETNKSKYINKTKYEVIDNGQSN